MYDPDPVSLYGELIQELEKRKVAFLQIKECGDIDQRNPGKKDQVPPREQIQDCCKQFRKLFTGTIIQNDGFKIEEGIEKGWQKAQDGFADAMTFGRLAIANPDLAQRIKN